MVEARFTIFKLFPPSSKENSNNKQFYPIVFNKDIPMARILHIYNYHNYPY